jgi:hypothetical protein
MQCELLLVVGGGDGAELLRSGPPLFQQHFRVLLCTVSFWRAIILSESQYSTRTYAVSSISRNHRTCFFICGGSPKRTNVQPCQPRSALSSGLRCEKTGFGNSVRRQCNIHRPNRQSSYVQFHAFSSLLC